MAVFLEATWQSDERHLYNPEGMGIQAGGRGT